jgi:anti-sigma factor RsiW
MSCSGNFDLKAYLVGELARGERTAVEDHVRGCQGCREELDRLNLTRAALATLEDEEIPRRIAFVSDRVFEPRWWQTIWHSGPAMGFASSALLAGAILVYGFARPVAPMAKAPAVDTAQIERQVEAQVSAQVSDSQAEQNAEFAKVLNATETRYEHQRQADMATVQQAADYYEKQIGRLVVASNVEYKQ